MSKPFSYFDSPDGEDSMRKLVAINKVSGLTGLGIATYYIRMYPTGFLETLGRYAYICLPILAMSTSFEVVKNSAANIRGKDDKLNWVLGACAAGGILGAWRRSTQAGFFACLVFSAAAAMKKDGLQHGWSLFDIDFVQRQGSVRSVNTADTTLTKYRPGNWTTGV